MTLAAWMIGAGEYSGVTCEALRNARHLADLKASRGVSEARFDLGRTILSLRRRIGRDDSPMTTHCCAA